MRICFFISSISLAGGTGRVCTAIANKLSSLKYEVIILSMYNSKPFFTISPDVKSIAVFKKKHPFKLFLPYVIMRLRNEVMHAKPDVIVNVDSALFIYSWVACIGANVKNVVWEHFNFNVSLNAKVRVIARKLAAKYSSAIVTLTQKDCETWKSKLDCKAPVLTINNPSPFMHGVPNDVLREAVVLAAGRLTYQKGFDRLIDVWQLIKPQSKVNWELHIVGSGEMRQELQRKIELNGLKRTVKLLPMSDDMSSHYQRSSIYCMTSRFEGFPMVLLEAQTFGLPVVSYNCETGPSEIINEENGVLIEDGNAQAMAKALMDLMQNKGSRFAMGKKAYQNSFNYSIDNIIKNWIQLFDLLLEAKHQAV